MGIQTGFRLLVLPVIFGTIGITTALLFNDASGLYALLIGCVGGLLIAELYIPSLLKGWERMGMPGDIKTPEQQELWEQEKGKGQRRQFLVILIGLIGAALLRNYFREIMPLVVPAGCGGLAMFSLRVGWLIYRKGGKLRP